MPGKECALTVRISERKRLAITALWAVISIFRLPIPNKFPAILPLPIAWFSEPKFITKRRSQVAVEFAKAPGAYHRDSRFENIKLLYSNPEAPVTLKIQSRKDSVARFELPVTTEPSHFSAAF